MHGSVATCGTPVPINYRLSQKEAFRWWNVFYDIYRMGRLSLCFWFDDPLLTKIWAKTILHFHCQWPWLLTFRPQICSHSCSCQALCFPKLEVRFSYFEKIVGTGRTDRQMDGRDTTINDIGLRKGRIIIFAIQTSNASYLVFLCISYPHLE